MAQFTRRESLGVGAAGALTALLPNMARAQAMRSLRALAQA
jgi:hypothetical protein